MERIFLLEDDEALGRGVAMALAGPDREVSRAASLAEAKAALAGQRFSLLVLDVNLPDGSALDLVRGLRAAGDETPVILLTANDLELDEVTGLEAGADDYITKPFSLAVLRARVAAHLRRQQRAPHSLLRRCGLDFDLRQRAVLWQGQPLRLTKSEYAICEHLAMHPGQTFSKEQLYEAAFGFDGTADAAAVTEHIKNIRAKLRAAQADPIETVWGVGYKWKNE